MPDPAAPVAATDVVELICHQEQLQVWTDELVADLALGDYLREDMDYADKIDLHRAVASEIKRIVSRAFDHPEAAAEIARLRAEVAELPARGVVTARAEIVGWLRAEADRCQVEAARHPFYTPEYRAALRSAAAKIESGAPQRWAAERERNTSSEPAET